MLIAYRFIRTFSHAGFIFESKAYGLGAYAIP